MESHLALLQGWARATRSACVTLRPAGMHDAIDVFACKPRAHGLIAHAAGRAYGDCALNEQGAVLLTCGLASVLAFDARTGLIEVEPGVTFAQLMDVFLPQGWAVPVTPGTGFATIGGAVANDVHGKNHELAGSFCNHVTALDLLTPDGAQRTIGPAREPALFRATCGGLGLTGIITRVAFTMLRVPGPAMAVTAQRLPDLDSFLAAMDAAAGAPYAVGWIDGTARGAALGRGILETAQPVSATVAQPGGALLDMRFDCPSWLLSPASIGLFNALYFRRAPLAPRTRLVHCRRFFHPLDRIGHWNRIYGRRGFYQFQAVVPFAQGARALRALLDVIAQSRRASFLAVLKRLGPGAPGPAGDLSFARAGYTLALDFPAGPGIEPLYARLVAITRDFGGRIYLAKDALLSAESFRAMYPRWRDFRAVLEAVDPHRRMQSDMSRRLRLREQG